MPNDSINIHAMVIPPKPTSDQVDAVVHLFGPDPDVLSEHPQDWKLCDPFHEQYRLEIKGWSKGDVYRDMLFVLVDTDALLGRIDYSDGEYEFVEWPGDEDEEG
jgi:hypothetical protein